MATIFGGIHCMAWFYAFPTYQDQVLWRISAVAITSIPCFFLVSFFTFFPLGCVFSCCCCCCAINGMMVPLCVMLYITARAILLVLMFITLYNLPPDTYKAVSWTSLVPHLQFLIIVLEIHFILL
ncbi:hypothetical protein BDR07DRAFT_1291447 [Suillus spraguei]|nr:hypothetical protein BDR07DRAFT_1291447 [Suillus spraguei]